MAKKIKVKHEPTEAEQKAEEAKKAEEAQRAAAGIQDEFQAKGFELVEWMQERQKLVLTVIALVVAGGMAFGVYTVVEASRNSDASVALTKGLDAFEAELGEGTSDDGKPRYKDATERNKAARDLFAQAAKEHGGTGAGTVAHLYAGHASMRLGEPEVAATHYQAFLDGAGKDDPLRFAGYAGLAAALDAKGDTKGAIAALEDLVNLKDKIDEDAALLELGRLHSAAGNPTQARAALERIAKDFPESSLKSRADELLATLPAAAPAPEGGDKGAGAGTATP